MDDLAKTERLNLRLGKKLKRQVARAAKQLSRERGEIIDESTLARDLIAIGVVPILERAGKRAAA